MKGSNDGWVGAISMATIFLVKDLWTFLGAVVAAKLACSESANPLVFCCKKFCISRLAIVCFCEDDKGGKHVTVGVVARTSLA